MTWKRFGAEFDTRVNNVAERATRRITRRNALRTAVVGGAAGIAALSIGQSPASAIAFDCGPTRRCGGCPTNGCPGGYSLCKGSSTSTCFNYQGYRCEWPSGYWVAARGGGRCNEGFYICYDCKGPGGCYDWCTCLSGLLCGKCCSRADVRQEQKRIQEALPAEQ